MLLSDREWLRMVSFALLAGVIIGGSTATALLLAARPPAIALVGTITGGGVAVLTLHVVLRVLLDQATEPRPEPTDGQSEATET